MATTQPNTEPAPMQCTSPKSTRAPPTPPSLCEDPHQVVQFSRSDEFRLQHLTEREANADQPGVVPLSDAERLELKELAARYQVFLAEGERRLREGVAPADRSQPPDSILQRAVTSTGSAMLQVGKGALFWGTLVATAVPGYLGKKMGVTNRWDHWNWLSDRLILGALPVVTQVGESGNHLEQLRLQCEKRRVQLGLVVACCTQEEMEGFGVGVLTFAQAEHWRKHLGVEEYEYCPFPDMTAQCSYEQIRHAVDRMHEVMHMKRQAVYVHCKAGKGRSWMVVMCYLLSFGGMDWTTAKVTVESGRHQVNPGTSQVAFAQEFARRFHREQEEQKAAQSQQGLLVD